VFRWEYTPGSTLYLVWSHYRDYTTGLGKWDFRENASHLFSVMPHNVWLIKFSYGSETEANKRLFPQLFSNIPQTFCLAENLRKRPIGIIRIFKEKIKKKSPET
jgi:hypothetical protein